MLDPEEVRSWVRHHFATVTDEEFIANVRHSSPDLARELWGDLTAAEILARRRAQAATVGEPLRAFDSAAADHPATDVARASRVPAPRRGIEAAPVMSRAPSPRRGVRGVLASISRSVLRLFS